jgi:solute carrier family 66, member 2
MIVVQIVLLKVALDHRHYDPGVPFADVVPGAKHIQRPYNFWQWRSQRPYVSGGFFFFLANAANEANMGV